MRVSCLASDKILYVRNTNWRSTILLLPSYRLRQHERETSAMMSYYRFIVSPIGETPVYLVRQNSKMKKLTSHPFDNTNRTTLSKSNFGNWQTELFTS